MRLSALSERGQSYDLSWCSEPETRSITMPGIVSAEALDRSEDVVGALSQAREVLDLIEA